MDKSTFQWQKKSVVIEAFQWVRGMRREQWPEWFSDAMTADTVFFPIHSRMTIRTLEGLMSAQPGDWIIRGIKGELYPCKPDIFAATYERPSPTPIAALQALVDAVQYTPLGIPALKAVEQARQVLAASTSTEPPKETWTVFDALGNPLYCAPTRIQCHEHINDALGEHGIEEASTWVVRPMVEKTTRSAA